MPETTDGDAEADEMELNYLVFGPHAWGADTNTIDALQNMMVHLSDRHIEDVDTLNLTVYEVRGDWTVHGVGYVEAPVIEYKEVLEVDAAALRELQDVLKEGDTLAESVLYDAEVTERKDDYGDE